MDRLSVFSFLFIVIVSTAVFETDASPRMIGGKDTAEGSAPWQASLRVRGQHQCSGSLLNHRWIITSAHCIVKYDPDNVIVVLGAHNLIFGGIAYRVDEVRIHPEYLQQHHKNDLALVKIDSHVDYDWNIQPVDLPRHSTADECKRHKCPIANFTGWQSAQADPPRNYNLQILELSLITIKDCQQVFPSVDDNNVCTFNGNDVREGLCYGDAGGPLVVDGALIAIGSWGSPCARGYPDVHTRIYYYVKWIKRAIADESDDRDDDRSVY